MSMSYCENCDKEVDTIIIHKNETIPVYGEDISVDADVLTCAVCGEELYCEELDNATLLKAYDTYRKKHKLLMPDEIKKIREQYGLSQRGFANLLNWGDKTIRRYEGGALQDKAHNSLLLFLRNPENMKAYLENNEVNISDSQRAKLLVRIDALEDTPLQKAYSMIGSCFSLEPSLQNGYHAFDFEKFCAMVVFFASVIPGLMQVKLLKLLNYSDMLYFKENGISISGTRYVHAPYGPVPDKYKTLFDMMENEHVAHIEIEVGEMYEKHLIVLDCVASDYLTFLSDNEKAVMNRVYEKFKDFGSSAISNYSHGEEGYKNTEMGEVISYNYAKSITFD